MTRPLRLVLVVTSTVVVLLTADGRHPRPVDRDVLRTAVAHRSAALVSLARAVSHLGDPLTLIVLAVASIGLLRWWSRSWSDALVPAIALSAGALLEVALKQVVARPRPPAALQLLHETGPSFPSGHTTGSAALFVAVAMVVAPRISVRWMRGATLAVGGGLAALVGGSRIVLGVHWPTDVLAGWCLGVAVAVAMVLVLHRRERARYEVLRRSDVGYPGAGPAPSSHDRLPTAAAS